MSKFNLIARKEWPLLLSYGSLLAVLVAGGALFGNLQGGATIGILFAWLFVVILISAFSVVYHAECLAHKLGEPYGTLVLTLSVIGLEVLMIVTVMLTKGENPKMARDTMYGVLMIVMNGLLGVSVIVGAWRHRIQSFNLNSSETYIGGIIALVGIGLIIPAFIPEKSAGIFDIYLIAACIVFYGIFLWMQTSEHRGFFEYKMPDGNVEDHSEFDTPFGIWYHVLLLVLTLIPLVILAKQLSVVLDAGLENLGLPEALVGLVVAVLILAPEGLAAVRAAMNNNLQRAVNICLGSALATIGLTIPSVLVISMIVGQEVTLGLGPVEIVLLSLSILLLMVSFGRGETNVLKGALQLVVFASYVVFIFM